MADMNVLGCLPSGFKVKESNEFGGPCQVQSTTFEKRKYGILSFGFMIYKVLAIVLNMKYPNVSHSTMKIFEIRCISITDLFPKSVSLL